MAFCYIFSQDNLQTLNLVSTALMPPINGGGASVPKPLDPNNLIYFFTPTSFLTNGVKLIDIFVHVLYFWTFFTSWKLNHSMYMVIAIQSFVLSLSTFFSMILLIVGGIVDVGKNSEKLKVSQYLDFAQKYFVFLMLYPLVLNQLLSYLNRVLWWRLYEKSRIILLVLFCVLLSAVASTILIHTSDMQRLYIPRVGFVDAGVPGYQMLINRLFYIFPFGSIVCYIILYFHIKRMTQTAISKSAVQSGERKVFIQLLITACFYGAICILFEIINAIEWTPTQNTAAKIDLVSVLNIINYLPEISLPLMLLLSNTDMRRRISTIIVPRGTQSHTVPVVPMM